MRKILVSQCLYGGEPVRYDGKSKAEMDSRFLKWKGEGRLIPICPEVFGGLPTPRADAQRQGNRIVARTGADVTAEYLLGAEEAVRLAKEHRVLCAVMKEKSPSCGSHRIYDGTFSGMLVDGQGLAVELLQKAGVQVFSEEQLEEVEKRIKNAESMFEGKTTVIFDMDGTLIDSVGIWNDVDRRLIEKLGGDPPPEWEIQQDRDDTLRRYKETPDPYGGYCGVLKERYGFCETHEEIIRSRYEIAADRLKNTVAYKPGAAAFVKALKAAGMTLAIASTTKRSNMEVYRTENRNIMEAAPIDRYFSLVYTREDVTEIKPEPEVYWKVMDALGVSQDECLVLEDSLVGAEAAKAAGIQVAVIYDRYSDREREAINALADYQIQDYTEALDLFRR